MTTALWVISGVGAEERSCDVDVPCLHVPVICGHTKRDESVHLVGRDASHDMTIFLHRLHGKDPASADQLEAILSLQGAKLVDDVVERAARALYLHEHTDQPGADKTWASNDGADEWKLQWFERARTVLSAAGVGT